MESLYTQSDAFSPCISIEGFDSDRKTVKILIILDIKGLELITSVYKESGSYDHALCMAVSAKDRVFPNKP